MFEHEEQICKKIESEYFSIINNRPEFITLIIKVGDKHDEFQHAL